MTAPSANILYKRVERALWKVLEDDTNFAATVKVGNRIKHCLDNVPDPDKAFNMTGDSPSVRLFPNGWKRVNRGTNTYALELSFALEIYTADKRTTRWYGDAQWYAFIAFLRLQTVNPATALDNVSEFLKLEVDSAIQDIGASPSHDEGWEASLDIKVQVKLNIAEVTA
jgi:hypothetical protein